MGDIMSKIIPISLILILFLGCSSAPEKTNNQYRSSDQDRPLVDSKYSLSADRQAFEEIRAQVPDNKRKENDESALMMQLFSNPEREPSQIRSQFDEIVRKKRAQFDKDISRERETFTKEERKKRDEFLKSQKQVRDDFNRSKQSSDEKRDFYRDQDQKRSEYFADERDRRNDFESDVRERRKNFEDYIRQKNNEFNQEYKSFQKKHEDFKKSKKEAASVSNSDASELDRELQEARSKQGTNLESGQ